MKKVVKHFYSDGGHGWLRIDRKEAESLNILDKISTYSYQSKNGRFIYLEEDCDAGIYFNAMKAMNVHVDVKYHHSEYSSIRSFPHYSKDSKASDGTGNLKYIKHPNGNEYEYNQHGKLIHAKYSDGFE